MNRLSGFLWLCVWLGLGLDLLLTLWLACVGLTYPYQLDYGEGIVLWFTQQLARGQTIYRGMSDFPYASSNYPPVAMLLAAALTPIFGAGYAGGRWLNVASALIVAALIYRIVRIETRARRAGALAALLFLGSPYVYHWIPLFRVDLLGLAFAFGGVYIVWQWERKRSTLSPSLPTSCLLPTAFFLLALYTKHTLFAAPLAAFGAIFLRAKRAAFAFALVLGALGGALFLALDYLTGGGFTFGLIESNATVFLPEQLVTRLENFALTFPILFALAVWGWAARVRARRIGVLEIYAATAFAGLAMAGRMGAWENYFFEAIAIACVFAGAAVGGLAPLRFGDYNLRSAVERVADGDRRPVRSIVPLFLLLQLALMWHDPRVAAELVARDLPANRELAAWLQRTPSPIISEDMGALVTSGKPVVYYTFQYSSLARSGKWDQRWELNGLRDGAFPLVILERGTREDVDHYRRFTREFVSALDRYYARVDTLGKYELYAPAPPLRLQAANFGDALALVGWRAQAETSKPGNLTLQVVWQARRALERRYTAFVHLEDATGAKVAQDDREPRGGVYPTTRWAVGEMVRETYTLKVPKDLPGDQYTLRVGWYDTETGERLPVVGSADDSVTLGE